MRYLLFLLLPIFSYAQQDSVVYEKRDTQWYKVTVRIEGQKKITIEEPYTSVDSLIKNTLINNLVDFGRQYHAFKLSTEEQEKDYLLKLRQADRQYRAFYNERPALDSLSNASQLFGTWLLNGVEIRITRQLRLLTASINFVCENLFWVNNNGQREYFFKRGKSWVSNTRKLEPRITRSVK